MLWAIVYSHLLVIVWLVNQFENATAYDPHNRKYIVSDMSKVSETIITTHIIGNQELSLTLFNFDIFQNWLRLAFTLDTLVLRVFFLFGFSFKIFLLFLKIELNIPIHFVFFCCCCFFFKLVTQNNYNRNQPMDLYGRMKTITLTTHTVCIECKLVDRFCRSRRKRV